MATSSKPGATGLLGLGIIGARVAANLAKAGWQVWVWSRTPRPFPCSLGAPSEVAARAKTVLVFLKDGPALLSCLEQMLPELGPEHVVVNHSTVAPDEARAAAKLVEQCGSGFVDAPFTGSRDAAAANQLVYYVAGDPRHIERVRPLLEVSAKQILVFGKIGEASLLKLATNMITAASVTALAQALALVRASGIDGADLATALEHNGARSGVTDLKLPNMLEQDFEPRFSVDNMAKDMRLSRTLLQRLGLTASAVAPFLELAESASAAGWGDHDFASIYRICSQSEKT